MGKALWWNWQNLKEDGGSSDSWLHGRAWLHLCESVFRVEWVVPGELSWEMTVGGSEEQLRFCWGLWFFTLYIGLNWPLLRRWKATNDPHGREISLSWYASAWRWRWWLPEGEWNSSTPKWRDGSFNPVDILLGREHYTKEKGQPILATLALPEKIYNVEVIPARIRWKRPRWPHARIWTGFSLNCEEGIPVPGKGESAWDCEDDAIYGTGSSAETVEGAVEDLRKTVLEQRERYGGKGWIPKASH